ncbi:hypothetical protein V2S84_26220, partial [Azotobacter chroococcum]|nr:hypothetical protein [Azotobacter chroococcum]
MRGEPSGHRGARHPFPSRKDLGAYRSFLLCVRGVAAGHERVGDLGVDRSELLQLELLQLA